ncbi:hypothetical protein PIB30_078106 [Stylosanthes scabra]|uniref:Putative plant transposon protein domain-containing protein n=1 Tax=Stylosanthes scabra TaxID=79078 RepID=A0ABU6XPC5_9FABA|nr:hypothetical protein [Stylosanthes scabra]
MASSSSTISVFDAHRFHKVHNQQLFESYARRRKVIQEAGFNLNEDEYPQIMEQIALRGWRRLAAPRTSISKLLVQEFYENAAISNEEAAERDELPYKSFVRGKEVDFSPSNIRRVRRFKREIAGAETDYNTRKAIDQRLDKVLRDLCIPGATWKMSSSQPAVPIQLRRTDLQPLARGCRCSFEGIHLNSKDPELSYITAKRMEKIRFPRNQPQQQQEDEEEDEPMPQVDEGNFEEEDQQQPQQDQQPQQHGFPNFQPRYESQYHEDLQGIEETLSSMKFFQQTFYENMQKSQADYMEEGNHRDKPTIEFDPKIEKTLKKNRSRVKAQRALQFDQEEANSEEGASEKPIEEE